MVVREFERSKIRLFWAFSYLRIRQIAKLHVFQFEKVYKMKKKFKILNLEFLMFWVSSWIS